MNKTIVFLAVSTFLTSFTPAFASETVEAFVANSSFDGQTYKYKVTAYNSNRILSQKAQSSCNYSLSGQGQVLSSVEIKVQVEADFNKPGQQVDGFGEVDVRRAIDTCLIQVPGGLETFDSPVEVILPKISTPSRMNAGKR